ncbi:hypothetical protein AYI69_g1330 [Smittium culicis]|uniref:Retrotransposon gag domain-containing protein n=1 Tax=Smittium culicis TaxID=133412 RepID=A0A1R1YQK3_9FUNG|nr:hypothetical protein AYI69_g5392 [Smittium culicis]OMJ29171.1 hypothetical protein AYI69_g1330 [Smittium culicis]
MATIKNFLEIVHGRSSDVLSIGIWINKIEAVIKFAIPKEENKAELFKLWLEGKAASWQFDMEQGEETSGWTLSEWLKNIQSHFKKVKGKSKKRINFELEKINLEPGESIVDLNKN